MIAQAVFRLDRGHIQTNTHEVTDATHQSVALRPGSGSKWTDA